MNNFLTNRMNEILMESTVAVIEENIISLRSSMRFLAKLHIQEGIVFKSSQLSRKIKRLLFVLGRMILSLVSFKSIIEEVRNGKS